MFVITNENISEFVGLDYASGGYPWISDSFKNAHIYTTRDDAQREINNKFMREFYPEFTTIVQINLEVV